MKRFKCHKVVWALKIVSMHHQRTVAPVLKGEDESIIVDVAYMRKHQPKVGGYYVRYNDAYESYSTAEAFEEGYTEIKEKHDGRESAQEDKGLSGLERGGDSPDERDKKSRGNSGGSSKSSPRR